MLTAIPQPDPQAMSHRTPRPPRPGRALLPALIAASLAMPVANAADNPGAHRHGYAQLQMAIEGNRIDVMFTSPANNLAGFEHKARTDEERATLGRIVHWLEENPVVDTQPAGCTVLASTIHLSSDHHDEEEAHHDDDGHGHDDGHHGEHEHHDEHHDEHEEHAAGEGNTHSEYEVSQQLACSSIGPGQVFRSAMLTEFEGLEVLTTEWVTSGGQGSARLTPDSPQFRIAD